MPPAIVASGFVEGVAGRAPSQAPGREPRPKTIEEATRLKGRKVRKQFASDGGYKWFNGVVTQVVGRLAHDNQVIKGTFFHIR